MPATMSFLDRLLDPITDAFTPELADRIVNLRVDSDLEKRITGLRLKSNDGTLTEDEEAEYKEFVEAVDVIAVIQSKARRFLTGRAS